MSKSTYEVYTANGPYTSQAAKVSAGTAPGGSASKPAASHTGNGAPTVIPGAAPGSATPGQSVIEGVTVGSMPVVNEINVKENPNGTIGTNVVVADAMPVTGPGVSNHTSPVSGGSPGSGVVGVQTGWVKLGNGFKYYKEDGSGYKTGWHSEYAADGSKVWYYFDEYPGNKEWMVTGWKRIKGSKDEKWYYFRADGKMSIYWKKLDGLWYYLEPQEDAGYMVMGWKAINGYWYYFVPEEDAGYMMVDWHKIGGKWYYFYKTEDKYGIMAANDMINHTDGKKYYLGSDGAMVTKATMPQVVFSGVTYEVAEDGACSEINNNSISIEQILQNIRNDTSLGLDAGKKDTLVTIGRFMLSAGYEEAFVAGMLGNIIHEANVGYFENSAYITHPEEEPPYLIYMDKHYSYRTKYSKKNITDLRLSDVEALLEKLDEDGWEKGKFGLGCVQWTGERTKTLVDIYRQIAGAGNDYITFEQVVEAEGRMICTELSEAGIKKTIYPDWKTEHVGNLGTAAAAYDAGYVLCVKYETPKNYMQEAPVRAKTARNLYHVMMAT